ncbi:MAG: sugar transferase [Paeniclostridium sordellii]|uniref:sugar transferase n=1 Tax=Paraclostridium sordellii TaxID=1505 RepID=UPI0005E0B52F|nr:sugar transferase [Paeniclostridium sordellii]MBS6025329.1 sugar transferase [Paeniclostridium sordellii]CEN94070.1 undecaprenyl phosphate galactosephosphotransferase [[Clostridium] sordellii] [Paeniclostridium sordellii]CEN96071.1 undecaprenyl phosphate galactosephosphotransferase [[Clostridium] sordellii] [Paeniclostridium sordellii]
MFIKNIIDRVFGLVLLILLSPVLLIISILIKIDSKGPVIFKQKRLGKNGQIFEIYKFRTMYVNAPDLRNEDGSTFNSDDDPRVTKIGKFLRKTSLDELTQIFNILKGDMSFIGPRPDLPDHYDLYTEFDKKKLSVKPGVTGYAQCNGRNSIEWKKRIEMDIFYINNFNLLLDIKILFKTVFSVLRKEGINKQISREKI